MFEEILDHEKARFGHELDTELTAVEWQHVTALYKEVIEQNWASPSRRIPMCSSGGHRRRLCQLEQPARRHLSPPAQHPLGLGHGGHRAGHGVRQSGSSSATGVAFTRNPSTGEKELYGEFWSMRKARTWWPASQRRNPSPGRPHRERLRPALAGKGHAGSLCRIPHDL